MQVFVDVVAHVFVTVGEAGNLDNIPERNRNANYEKYCFKTCRELCLQLWIFSH